MPIKNFHQIKPHIGPCHDGDGLVRVAEVFGKGDLQTPLQFIHHTVLPPKATIGLHKHGNDEEVYIVIAGSGVMEVDGVKTAVTEGDTILNPPYGTHALYNTSDTEELRIIVFAAKGAGNPQKPAKPKPEEIVNKLLEGENLARARELIAYFKENKISTQWTNTNTWKAMKKGEGVCYIRIGLEPDTAGACYVKFKDPGDPVKGAWDVQAEVPSFNDAGGYEEIQRNQQLFDLLCEKVRKCTNCGNKKKCAPGVNVTLWGRELINRCKFTGIPFVNPNAEELPCVMKLIDKRLQAMNNR